jgi:hypothetical protein
MDLALVSSDMEARRFQLWEATPIEYLERLLLQNELVLGLNRLEGVIDQGEADLAIVTSQPRFDIVPVTLAEIDAWFSAQGFQKVTPCGYYRAQDNLGVFDAHVKNLVRFEDTLIPFVVIPCRPAGGFLSSSGTRLPPDTASRLFARSARQRDQIWLVDPLTPMIINTVRGEGGRPSAFHFTQSLESFLLLVLPIPMFPKSHATIPAIYSNFAEPLLVQSGI